MANRTTVKPKIPDHEAVETAELQRRLEALRQCKMDLANKAFEIGGHLTAIKEMVGHGNFMDAVGELGWSGAGL